MGLRRAAGALLRSSPWTASSQPTFIRLQQHYLRQGASAELRGIAAPFFYARPFSTSPLVRSDATSAPPSSNPSSTDKPNSSTSPSSTEASSSPTQQPGDARFTDLIGGDGSPGKSQAAPTSEGLPSLNSAYDRSPFGSSFSPAKSSNKSVMETLTGAARSGGWKSTTGGKDDWASPFANLIPEPYETTQNLGFPRLNSSTGRSVEINSGRDVDLAKAMKRLEIIVAQNRVRADLNRQRFHERAGLKRKRLKSERWRKRFKEGFKYLTARVTKLRKQGW